MFNSSSSASHSELYDTEFYASYQDITLSSARRIVPIVVGLISPKSVIDVGCGVGLWLKVFQENGVTNSQGLDGAHVHRSELLIREDNFVATDLSGAFQIEGCYDLAVCLEVGEHLSPDCAHHLVRELTLSAPVVLFSAAIPGQRGRNHINEQWPSYWRDLFRARGYKVLDLLRPRLRDDDTVAWWYRQNIVIFANDEAINTHAALQNSVTTGQPLGIEWVHIDLVKNLTTEMAEARDQVLYPSLLMVIRQFPRALLASLRRRFGKERLNSRIEGGSNIANSSKPEKTW
jgi:hypothetical protein